ncbi:MULTISPECIES: hypothetical protein [unclassified Streptomyces]|uniref:hypothetical protein n=1 Tax=unclassified Streptomyces TaxID=2593676 RepID=UPI0036A8E83C
MTVVFVQPFLLSTTVNGRRRRVRKISGMLADELSDYLYVHTEHTGSLMTLINGGRRIWTLSRHVIFALCA